MSNLLPIIEKYSEDSRYSSHYTDLFNGNLTKYNLPSDARYAENMEYSDHYREIFSGNEEEYNFQNDRYFEDNTFNPYFVEFISGNANRQIDNAETLRTGLEDNTITSITIIKNIQVRSIQSQTDKIINLNGNTLTITNDFDITDRIEIINGIIKFTKGKINISSNGNLILDRNINITTTNSPSIEINNGKLDIKNFCDNIKSEDTNGIAINQLSGIVNISGGNITGNNTALNHTSGELFISGGIFNGNTGIKIEPNSNSTVNINQGNIQGKEIGIGIIGSSGNCLINFMPTNSPTTLVVEGGNYGLVGIDLNSTIINFMGGTFKGKDFAILINKFDNYKSRINMLNGWYSSKIFEYMDDNHILQLVPDIRPPLWKIRRKIN